MELKRIKYVAFIFLFIALLLSGIAIYFNPKGELYVHFSDLGRYEANTYPIFTFICVLFGCYALCYCPFIEKTNSQYKNALKVAVYIFVISIILLPLFSSNYAYLHFIDLVFLSNSYFIAIILIILITKNRKIKAAIALGLIFTFTAFIGFGGGALYSFDISSLSQKIWLIGMIYTTSIIFIFAEEVFLGHLGQIRSSKKEIYVSMRNG